MSDKEKLLKELRSEIQDKYPGLTQVDLDYIFNKFQEAHEGESVPVNRLVSEFNDFAAQTARILLRKPSANFDPTRNSSIGGEQNVRHDRKK